MSNLIQIKRGQKVNLPTLNEAEFGLCKDTEELFIGNNENLEVITKPKLDIYQQENNIQFDVNGLNSSMGSMEITPTYIYPMDKLSLSNTNTYSYYPNSAQPDLYPSVMLDIDGNLIFHGNAKVSSPLRLVDGMVHFATIFHFDITLFSGVPVRGSFIGVNDSDFNDMIEIPFMIKTDGKILLKNLGENNKYYTRIDLSGAKCKLTLFGQEHIQRNIDKVLTEVENKSLLSSAQLIYFTDIHHDIKNYRRYAQLKAMEEVNKRIGVKTVLNCGDSITEYPQKILAIQSHKDLSSCFHKNQYVVANGNHDLNIEGGQWVHPVNIKRFYNNNKFIYAGADKYYGYMDIEESKLRIIVWDTVETSFDTGSPSAGVNVTQEQINWHIKNSLKMNGKIGWNVILMSHILPWEQTTEDDTLIPNRVQIRSVIENFKNGQGDFTSQGRQNVVCWIGGHEHKDRIVYLGGIAYVTSLLARSETVGYQEPSKPYASYTREYGTEYEFCFDIISIVDSERKAYFSRVGRVTETPVRTVTY